MTVTVKLDKQSAPVVVQVDDVVAFAARYPDATVEVGGRWVPFEKKFAIVEL